MRVRASSSAAALAVIVGALAPSASAEVAPPDAVRVGAAGADRELSILLGLRRDGAGLTRFVDRVSDPESRSFGRYADVPELARRFGARPSTRRAVLRWLRAHGLPARVSATGSWVETRLTVGQGERLFRTRLAGYRAAGSARFVAPLRAPRLPVALRPHVTGLVGLDDRRRTSAAQVQPPPLASPRDVRLIDRRLRESGSSLRLNGGTPRSCPAGRAAATPVGPVTVPAYTPNQYLHAYRYDQLHRRGLKGQGQRIAVIEIDGFRRSDITTFARCFGVRAPDTPITRVGISRNLAPGDETTLDLEVLSAGAPGLEEIQVMETAGTNSSLLAAYEEVLGRPRSRRASVISASLGQCEPEFYGDTSVVELYEDVFRMAAAAGVSNVASTGDVGSTGCPIGGENSNALALPAVQHPASSPYVTAVGGTNLELNRRNRIIDEITWHDAPLSFGGGTGGYSLFFERPRWQRGPGLSGTQRVVPDIAMLADGLPGYAIYCSNAACDNAGWSVVGGTSAATPLFAAGVAIANQQADRAGTSRLGYLNPLIYQLARKGSRRPVFNDVTETDNDLAAMLPAEAGGGRPIGCCPATRNHDAASGWGSIFLPAFSREARRVAERR